MTPEQKALVDALITSYGHYGHEDSPGTALISAEDVQKALAAAGWRLVPTDPEDYMAEETRRVALEIPLEAVLADLEPDADEIVGSALLSLVGFVDAA